MMSPKMLLLVTLLLGASLQDTQAVQGPNVGEECCHKYFKGAIPVKRLRTWYKTPEGCSKSAVVFTTFRGKSICMDPKDVRARKAIKYLQMKL